MAFGQMTKVDENIDQKQGYSWLKSIRMGYLVSYGKRSSRLEF
jgi:hypothetical protein